LSRVRAIQSLVRSGLYYLTEHADEEALEDGFDIYDVENGILSGTARRTWPKEGTIEVVGVALDGRAIGVVCRLTASTRVCVITVYEDRKRNE
jgi:HTH-type transcriptional regulator/antitoxin MqsA